MPNGIIRDYQITYYQTELGPDNATVLLTGGTGLDFRIDQGLEPFTNYSVFLRAFTVAFGEQSAVRTIRTNESGETEIIVMVDRIDN